MLLAPKDLRPVPTRCFMNEPVYSDEKGHRTSHDIEGVATASPPPKI